MEQRPSQIGYVRYLGAWGAASISAIMAIGVAVLLLIGFIFEVSSRETPLVFLLSLLVLLIILFAYLERASVTERENLNSLYSLLPIDRNVQLGFLNSWLLLGGLLALGAVLAWVAALHVDRLLLELLAIETDQRLLVLILVALMVANQLLGTNSNWQLRSLILFSAVVLVVGLAIGAVARPSAVISGSTYVPIRDPFPGIITIAVGLWGIGFFLERRHLLTRSARVQFLAPVLPYVVAALLGSALGVFLLRFPRLGVNEELPLLALAASAGPWLLLLLGVLLILVALFALNQAIASTTRLIGQMGEDGLLPPFADGMTNGRAIYGWLPLLIGLFIVLLALLVPFELTLGLAVSGFLGATFLIHALSAFRHKAILREDRALKIPFSPLLPLVAAAISLTLILLQPVPNLAALGLWLLVGELYYLFYARSAAVDARQAEEIVAESEDVPPKSGYRVIVCVSNPRTAGSLLQTGLSMAETEQGDLLVLNVVTTTEQTTDAQNQAAAQAKKSWLQELLTVAGEMRVHVTTLVRVAPTVDEGIRITAWEVEADTLVLGWPVPNAPVSIASESIAEAVVRRSRAQVVTLHGAYSPAPARIMVPMTSYAHAPAALALGQSLARQSGGEVVAMTLVRQKLTPELEQDLQRRLQEEVDKLPDPSHVSTEIVQITDMAEAIARLSNDYDLALMGMSAEGLMANTEFGGVPASAAEAASCPVMLVKSEEGEARFWLRRAWDRLSEVLPTIDARQRSEVYLSMRRGARATADFYVLIILSASIAFFGLIQNSGAVIIGAMLVAPLMSPIMALAHGVVQGNTTMLRQALDSTVRGTMLAILVATLLTFLLLVFAFPMTPTNEILARTQPGIPDLIVALASGVAAAYALSRSEVAAALPGVSIAVALVPPLAVVGFGMGTLQFDIASGALLLFATNLAAIVVAGAATFLLLGFRPPARVERDDQTRFGLRVALMAMVLVSIPLLYATIVANRQTRQDAEIATIVESFWLQTEAQVDDLTVRRERRDVFVDFVVYDFSGDIDDSDLLDLRNLLASEVRNDIVVDARILPTNRLVVNERTTPVPTAPASAATTPAP